jgi:hypothetical protein
MEQEAASAASFVFSGIKGVIHRYLRAIALRPATIIIHLTRHQLGGNETFHVAMLGERRQALELSSMSP